ncbi:MULTISPECIES: DUF4116 domain-containing protein, partial [unclassified Endozoicomonas]
ELIFALHQRFVNALAPVSTTSGQGTVSHQKWAVTYVDFTPPRKKASLLTPSFKAAIEGIMRPVTVVSLVDALIVNLELGLHVGLIELLENAGGGKERTLRLKFSDRFRRPDGSDGPHKLKRMWLLVRLLKAIGLHKDADSMELGYNPAVGEIIVECVRITSTQAMLGAFQKLFTVVTATRDLDSLLRGIAIFEGDQWNFSLLAERLNSNAPVETDRFAFQHCLFLMVYWKFNKMTFSCYPLLSTPHQEFIDHSRQLVACMKKSEDHLKEMLMSDEVSEDTRRELLHHLLLLDPNKANAISLIEHIYGLSDQYFVVEPSHNYRLKFYIPPCQPSMAHKEKVRDVLLKHGLKYASQQIRNDRDLVLTTIAEAPDNLEYVSEELKGDRHVVMTAITRDGYQLLYAAPKFQDDDVVVKTAISKTPSALKYASERLRGDKNIVQIAVARDIRNLDYASEEVLNDREYLLNLIEHNSHAFMYAATELQHDNAFIRSATLRNPELHRLLKALGLEKVDDEP